ncbi:MAG: YncE family protein [Candidatus Bathyarchaeia archaeon]|jgi:YVTN family beta-propeller protein
MKKSVSIILVLLSLISLGTACLEPINAQSQSVSAIQLVDTINLRATGVMAYNPVKGEMWAGYSVPYTNELGMNVSKYNSIAVISDTNHSIIATIEVGYEPSSIAYDSGKNLMFVVNRDSRTVSVVSCSNYSVLATIDLNDPNYKGNMAPTGAVYDSRKGEIFVFDYFTGNITVISDSTYQVVATFSLGTNPTPQGMVYDANMGEIFVKYYQIEKTSKPSNFVTVIDDRSYKVIATIPLSSNSGAWAFDSGKGELYIATANNSVSVISDKTNSVVATISVPLGTYTPSLAYDSAKGVIFTANYSNNSTSIISDSTHTVIETVQLGTNPGKIAYNSGKGELFVTNSGAPNILVFSDASLPNSPTAAPNITSSPTPTPTPSVPEFPLWTILPLFAVATLLSIVFIRKVPKNSVLE